MTTEPSRASFRIGFVPGVTLSKWSRLWEERRADLPLDVVEVSGDATDVLDVLRGDDRVDMVLARLPLALGDDFSSIALYDERAVVCFGKEHPLAAADKDDELSLGDLAGEVRHDLDPALDEAQAIEVVATGSGVAVMPQSLARLHGRSGVTHRFLSDVPPTTIALVWPIGELDDDIDDFIGVVRGRTRNSSRSRRRDDDPQEAPVAGAKGPGKGGGAGGKAGAAGGRGSGPGQRKTPPGGRGGPQRGTGRSRPRRGR
ncbi:LysR family transcriptional regulator substrate-binding protein [Frigoribacterium sp. ACAM 257]|uniref:LysR family transcriptional regulator substrate-binding protein n=1 Tax=Frigoribacterium sp. ACAM 257 TaxID=2508998 RepID=UPI0011B95C29|nr:LysR family transcriptional regulator substrate-binding protein [Frigoribacterium sp. ACAM 257]TWX38825.1 LysR family transcriptional regulator substrate-binding protein [Frigoribacterium sp. ACAM 257]